MNILYSTKSEWLKIKRSAALKLTLVGGFFIPAIMIIARCIQKSKTILANTSDIAWQLVFDRCWQYMAVFLLPLGITLATSLIAQVEFRNNGWKQLFVTPQRMTVIFIAKALVVLFMLGLFFLLFNIGIYLAGVLPSFIFSDIPFPVQRFPLHYFLTNNAAFFINSLPILAIQYFLSLHLRNFIVPIAIGFALLLASNIAMSSEYGFYMPYCYGALEFLKGDSRINPNVNIRHWALAYTFIFTLLNYLMFITKVQGTGSRFFQNVFAARWKSLLLIAGIAFSLAAITAFLQPHNPPPLSTTTMAIEKRIKEIEERTGFVKYTVSGHRYTSIEERMKHFNIRGMSMALIHNYTVEWVKSYGWADEETGKRATPQTLFMPGSISKSLNALAFLKLYEQGKLNLFCDINQYLTSWKFNYDNSIVKGRKITLAQLLSHSAGLNVHGFGYRGYELTDTLPRISEILDGKKPAHSPRIVSVSEPGKKYEYSGGGTMVSQQVLMDITGQPYDAYLYQHVLLPLNMTGSFFTQPPPPEKISLLASGYSVATGHQRLPNKFPVQPEQAAAGLWTTAGDLANMVVNLQRALRGDAHTFLNRSTVDLMLTPYNDQEATMGFFITHVNGEPYFQHDAGNPGFSGKFIGSLSHGNGLVVLINSDDGQDFMEELTRTVASVYHWHGYDTLAKEEKIQSVEISNAQRDQIVGIYESNRNIVVIDTINQALHYRAAGRAMPMYFRDKNTFVTLESANEMKFQYDKTGAVTEMVVTEKEVTKSLTKRPPFDMPVDRAAQYLGKYTEPLGEVDSIYFRNGKLQLYSENFPNPKQINFLNATEFYLDDGNIYQFVKSENEQVLGVRFKYGSEKMLLKRVL